MRRWERACVEIAILSVGMWIELRKMVYGVSIWIDGCCFCIAVEVVIIDARV